MDPAISDFIKSKFALVVEDDQAIAQLLKINLMQLGFEVDMAYDAEMAEHFLQQKKYSLCLLDWMLPRMQGIDFLKKNRTQIASSKIMMVTAKADPDSIVMGLECGADDYLTKPFDAKVLAARVRQLMRRLQFENSLISPAEPLTDEQIQVEGLVVHLAKHVVVLNENEIHLTPSEFKLLAELLKAKGRVLTRDQLIDLIQGEDVTVTGRTIDTHTFTLRKKLGEWAKHIETIRGVGYRILFSTQDATEPEAL